MFIILNLLFMVICYDCYLFAYLFFVDLQYGIFVMANVLYNFLFYLAVYLKSVSLH
jgi:hypothetical protein